MGSGSELSERYHREVVGPALTKRWPNLRYAAGRLGSGSDVLGYDDATSEDHDWGLRLTILVAPELTAEVENHLEAVLPAQFLGMPTRPVLTWTAAPILAVEVASVDTFARGRLGVGANEEWTVEDWLSFTGQAVSEVRSGPVFLDTDGALTALRRRLDWYPDDIWRWILAADWSALREELPFVGRTGQRGDDLGSRIIAARLARTAMHLTFMLHRAWPPYSKWLGTAFRELPASGDVRRGLEEAVAADEWQERQRALGEAIQALARLQTSRGLPSASPGVAPFYDRPHLGVAAIHEALLETIESDQLRARVLTGTVEQWCESVPALLTPIWRRRRS
jgi:hypothetical protein